MHYVVGLACKRRLERKVELLESVLEVSGQRECESSDCDGGHDDVGASDCTYTSCVQWVPDSDITVNCQKHGQPDTQQTQQVDCRVHPRVHACKYADVPRWTDVTK